MLNRDVIYNNRLREKREKAEFRNEFCFSFYSIISFINIPKIISKG